MPDYPLGMGTGDDSLAMTHGQLQDRVRVYIDDLNVERVSPRLITENANAVVRHLWIKLECYNPEWALTFVTLVIHENEDVVPLPANYGVFCALLHEDSTELCKWSFPADPILTNLQKPYEYRIERGQIRFRSRSDAEYAMYLWYKFILPRMEQESDPTGLPVILDELVVSRTAQRLGAQINAEMVNEEERKLFGVLANPEDLQPVGYWTKRRR